MSASEPLAQRLNGKEIHVTFDTRRTLTGTCTDVAGDWALVDKDSAIQIPLKDAGDLWVNLSQAWTVEVLDE